MKTINNIDKKDIEELGEKSAKIAAQVVQAMDKLGVTKLGGVVLKHVHSHTHGTQEYIHLVEHTQEYEYGYAQDLLRSTIDNSTDTYYDFGEMNLPFRYPTLCTVLAFLDCIDSVNEAIKDKQAEILKAIDTIDSVKIGG